MLTARLNGVIESVPVQKVFLLSISLNMTSLNGDIIKNTLVSRNSATAI